MQNTTKTLLLIRHAEAQEAHYHEPDIKRTLTQHGIRSAAKLGEHLKQQNCVFDHLMVSTAFRTEMTAKLIAEQFDWPMNKIEYSEELYNASPRVLLQSICSAPEEVNTLAVVAHYPGLPHLAEVLTNKEMPFLQPAGVIKISLEVDHWQEVSEGTGTLIEVINELS
ncbi:SixA phosphatase family protein [Persicobacter psychrovividus]|uniref:Phosphohistidine phosphatase n=1 Tax=Persicobacter psychrovividus TaxID=387638 RepID=A0ABM7VC92_9BACT|nr:hypothetical protein PEPS_08370 [Persicobacter psychrovividus]